MLSYNPTAKLSNFWSLKHNIVGIPYLYHELKINFWKVDITTNYKHPVEIEEFELR